MALKLGLLLLLLLLCLAADPVVIVEDWDLDSVAREREREIISSKQFYQHRFVTGIQIIIILCYSLPACLLAKVFVSLLSPYPSTDFDHFLLLLGPFS